MKNLFLAILAFCSTFILNFFGGDLAVAKPTTHPLKPINEIFEPAGSFSPERFWKVAVVQWNPPTDAPLNPQPQEALDYKKNIRDLMEQKIREAAKNGAQFVALSECAALGYPNIPELPAEEINYRSREDIAPYVETVPGPTVEVFQALAKELHVWIQYGMAEVDAATQLYYNVAVVINSRGEYVTKYRKQNLFELEEKFLSPGKDVVTYETPAGKFGIVICSDVYFQPILEGYKNLRLDALVLSTSWAEQNTGMDYFRRAGIEVGAYLLAANQNYFPDSGVINPDGTLQSHIRQSLSSIVYGYLPLKK